MRVKLVTPRKNQSGTRPRTNRKKAERQPQRRRNIADLHIRRADDDDFIRNDFLFGTAYAVVRVVLVAGRKYRVAVINDIGAGGIAVSTDIFSTFALYI